MGYLLLMGPESRWPLAKNLSGPHPQPSLQSALMGQKYDTLDWWKNLPTETITLVRTASNRDLRESYVGTDRRRKYGPKAPTPSEWLQERSGWQTLELKVRCRTRRMAYRVEGPCLRYRAADIPLFLIVVRGQEYYRGQKRCYRKPAYYLVKPMRGTGNCRCRLKPCCFGPGSAGNWGYSSGVEDRLWRG